MKISKTAFKQYAKCDRIYPLENIYLHKLDSNLSYFDEENVMEILGLMFDEESGEDLIIKDEKSLEEMLKYYNDVEKYAIEIASKKFDGKIEYFKETKKQKNFSYKDSSGNIFYCYLDGYLENEDEIIVVEVKATTSKKFKIAGSKENPLFIEDNNILLFNETVNSDDKVFINHYNKLFDIHSDTGKYVFDIAVERNFVENSILQNHPHLIDKKIKYYLAVLNSEYVFDGKYEDNEPIYTDDLISFIDLTKITYEYLEKIDEFKKDIVNGIKNNELQKQVFGKKCGYKGASECIFFDVCFPRLKEKGSVLEYMQARTFGPDKMTKVNLVNKGFLKLDDIEEAWLKNKNNIIQRDSYIHNNEHINQVKIRSVINSIQYPIYHLDFESFPCPLPRYKFEKPYSQSLFQYSIHIEKSPGDCNIVDDNYSFLVSDFNDHRKELIEELIKVIDLSKGGTVLVYNISFEYNRIGELSYMFPEYKSKLREIQEHMFDLIDVVKTNEKLYLGLGFNEEESKEINYYHSDLKGSYSIKKVLPLFSDLSYSDLNVQNGNEAIYSYIKFRSLSREEIEEIRRDLLDYCRQDTWAMVVILNKLRNKVM